MPNCIVTGFDEIYYKKFGLFWLISLREIAKYQQDIVIFGKNLPLSIKNTIHKFDAKIIDCNFHDRNNILKNIKTIDFDKCVYYDADVWFQDTIDELFDFEFEQINISQNMNFGFIATCKKNWTLFSDFSKLFDLFDDDCLITFYTQFKEKFSFVDNTYNLIELFSLTEDEHKLKVNNKVAKVIHPSGAIKNQLGNSNLSFSERHKDLIAKFSEKKLPKLLLKKN